MSFTYFWRFFCKRGCLQGGVNQHSQALKKLATLKPRKCNNSKDNKNCFIFQTKRNTPKCFLLQYFTLPNPTGPLDQT